MLGASAGLRGSWSLQDLPKGACTKFDFRTLAPKGGPFWDPIFSTLAPGTPKRAPSENRSALCRAQVCQKCHPERGLKTGPKNEPKKGLKLRGFGVVKTIESVKLSSQMKVFGF